MARCHECAVKERDEAGEHKAAEEPPELDAGDILIMHVLDRGRNLRGRLWGQQSAYLGSCVGVESQRWDLRSGFGENYLLN